MYNQTVVIKLKENKKEIVINNEQKLIDILSSNLKDFSKRTIKNYLKYEMIEIDGKIETNANLIVKKDSKVTVYFTKRIVPKIDIKILYKDDDLIAIDKPSGLLSISNSKEKEITAFRLVSDYIKTNNKKAKLFVVHRLDEQTSGILLFAKNLKIKELLQKNWNEYVKLREYTCVVKGKMPTSGRIETYLTMNHFQIVHSTKNKEIGHFAITRYKLLKYKNTYSLLRVEIDTGRRNQIRVHLSEQGHPIIGDKKYGAKVNPIGRLGLHASRLKIVDPRTNKILDIKSSVPECIVNLIK